MINKSIYLVLSTPHISGNCAKVLILSCISNKSAWTGLVLYNLCINTTYTQTRVKQSRAIKTPFLKNNKTTFRLFCILLISPLLNIWWPTPHGLSKILWFYCHIYMARLSNWLMSGAAGWFAEVLCVSICGCYGSAHINFTSAISFSTSLKHKNSLTCTCQSHLQERTGYPKY